MVAPNPGGCSVWNLHHVIRTPAIFGMVPRFVETLCAPVLMSFADPNCNKHEVGGYVTP
jgi:hypothetical protein